MAASSNAAVGGVAAAVGGVAAAVGGVAAADGGVAAAVGSDEKRRNGSSPSFGCAGCADDSATTSRKKEKKTRIADGH